MEQSELKSCLWFKMQYFSLKLFIYKYFIQLHVFSVSSDVIICLTMMRYRIIIIVSSLDCFYKLSACLPQYVQPKTFACNCYKLGQAFQFLFNHFWLTLKLANLFWHSNFTLLFLGLVIVVLVFTHNFTLYKKNKEYVVIFWLFVSPILLWLSSNMQLGLWAGE